MVGLGVKSYSATNMVPSVAASTDVSQACQMATAMAPVLFSFERVATRVEENKILLTMLSGHCASQQAWIAQLNYFSAVKHQQAEQAQDARILERRALITAAQRYWLGYQAKQNLFAPVTSSAKTSATPLANSCPKKFSDTDQLYWLVGMMDGLLAIMSDSLAERAANIPLSAIGEIAQDAKCLNDAKWWGLASAIPAMVAGLKKGDASPYLPVLQRASANGYAQGVRLASVLEANIYVIQGNDQALKQAIRRFTGADQPAFQRNKDFALFDAAAEEHMQAISDQLWVRATGHRTPIGQLGQFWDDAVKAVNDVDLSDIL